MKAAQYGDKVVLRYKSYLNDGTVLHTKDKDEPLQVILGENDLLPALEDELVGMGEGDTKHVELEPDNAFGEKRDELVLEVKKELLPHHLNPEKGMVLKVMTKENTELNLKVIDIREDSVKLDANHPLAGKSLKFDLELLQVN